MVPSFKNTALEGIENKLPKNKNIYDNTALIFPEISFILYFTIFSCKQYNAITDLICIIEKRQYL